MDVHSPKMVLIGIDPYPYVTRMLTPPWIPVLAYLALMVNNFSSLPSYPCCRSRTLSAVANAEPHLFHVFWFGTKSFNAEFEHVWNLWSLSVCFQLDLESFCAGLVSCGSCMLDILQPDLQYIYAVLRYGTIHAVDSVANATPSIKLQIFNESQFSVAGLRPKVKGAMNCAPCCPKKIAVALDLAQPWRRKTSGRSGGGLLFSWRWNLWSRFYHPLQDNDKFWE